jgi:hypothetical protein
MRGKLSFWSDDRELIRTENAVLRDWARILVPFYAQQSGLPVVPVNMIYVEFVNDTPPIAVPTFDRTDSGLDYYDGLSVSLNHDFLRIPIALADTFNDPSLGDTLVNSVSLIARTAGTAGVHGKTLTPGSSVLIGGALVAAADLNDRSKDVVHSRAYVSSGAQKVYPAVGQVHAKWELTFD